MKNETQTPCPSINGQAVCRFADIQILRYCVDRFDTLPIDRKLLIYHLSEASLWGRDIIFDQNGSHSLRIRHLLEAVYLHYSGPREGTDWEHLKTYLYRVWFSSGIHHHYGSDKFLPDFSADYLRGLITDVQKYTCQLLWLDEATLEELIQVIFDPTIQPKRTQQSGEADLLQASSVNFYDPKVSQQDASTFYTQLADEADETARQAPPSYGLNSRLAITSDGTLYEQKYHIGGLYSEALQHISEHLKAALAYVETELQRQSILALLEYYKTGDLQAYNRHCTLWVQDTKTEVDFINGFTEVYADPLGLKGSWEGLVHLRNHEASKRTELISQHAKWFEEHAPIDNRFKKSNPVGISATVVDVLMLAGDSYPATPIGINLPNADWIRAEYGSKSVTIENIHRAYATASQGNGMDDAFIPDQSIKDLLKRYDSITNELHTDLHECLGHGSGQLLSGVSPDALGPYASTIEEARADLFALYYMADPKLLELGLLPEADAYKACYYRYLLNGLVTQLVRIPLGAEIEEAHMRNRALISRYILERGQASGAVSLSGVHLTISDYPSLRLYIADLLAEVQRIKSEGDLQAARKLVETYAICIDQGLHAQVLDTYQLLDIAPYRGFVNPHMVLHVDDVGQVDVQISYKESYEEQMLRYSRDYSALPFAPSKLYEALQPKPSEATMSTAKEIRNALRLAMDGFISNNMRQKGLHYGINFGLTLEYIERKAKTLPQDKELADYLISRQVRELKLIAHHIYPVESMDFTIATSLASRSFSNPELRDCIAKHLYDRVPSAPQWAMAWVLDRSGRYYDITGLGYIILARWLTKGYQIPSETLCKELLCSALQILAEETEYISEVQRSALLFVKRWGRFHAEGKSRILSAELYQRLGKSAQPIQREFYHDIGFELDFS